VSPWRGSEVRSSSTPASSRWSLPRRSLDRRPHGLDPQRGCRQFHETTGVSRLRPGARIELTLPGQYEKLLQHIATHQWYLGVEQKREVPYPEAVASWYDRVYLPTVEAIRSGDALKDFPNRTEADLYLWITEHHWYMHESGLAKGHGIDGIIKEYVRNTASFL